MPLNLQVGVGAQTHAFVLAAICRPSAAEGPVARVGGAWQSGAAVIGWDGLAVNMYSKMFTTMCDGDTDAFLCLYRCMHICRYGLSIHTYACVDV